MRADVTQNRRWLQAAIMLLPLIASREVLAQCQVNVDQQWKAVAADNLDACLAQVDAATQVYNALGFKFGKWNDSPVAADRYTFYQSDDGGRNWRTLKAKSELTRPVIPDPSPQASTGRPPPVTPSPSARPAATTPATSAATHPVLVTAAAPGADIVDAPVPPAPVTQVPIQVQDPNPPSRSPAAVVATTTLPSSTVRPRPAVIADSHGPYFTPSPGPATDAIPPDSTTVESGTLAPSQSTPESAPEPAPEPAAEPAAEPAGTADAVADSSSAAVDPAIRRAVSLAGQQPCILRDTTQRQDLGMQSREACIDALDRSANLYDGNGYKYAFWGSDSLIADRNSILSSDAGEDSWTVVRSRGQR